jgi:subtilisin family serine protease
MKGILFVLVSLLFGCPAAQEPLLPPQSLPRNGEASVLVTNPHGAEPEVERLLQQAQELGITVDGHHVLRLTGAVSDLRKLNTPLSSKVAACLDEEVELAPDPGSVSAEGVPLTLAREEFGLSAFWRDHPEADGRQVVVGVIDDGVSPSLSGLQLTTTGERKYINHHGISTSFTAIVEETDGTDSLAQSYDGAYDRVTEARVSESFDSAQRGGDFIDLNGNRRRDSYEIRIFESLGDEEEEIAERVICVDTNQDGQFEAEAECLGDFALTGQYQYWDRERTLVLMARYDEWMEEVTLYPGEEEHDNHGEGVASVLTGYRPGIGISGIAPGAQLADYDIMAPSFHPDERKCTINTFLQGLEWMGRQGVEVVNISYNFYFFSVASQQFMAAAIANLVEEYNFVVTFSAGNDGPALGSFHRGLIYPPDTLVAGAMASRAPSEMIFGVTGLPEQGRVLHYSSRGPGADGGSVPTVLAPVAAMAASPDGGFRPFAGTSSAAPAVAGLAAVLLSYIKAHGWPVDAAAVSHSIRLSGRPLADTPYVAQGAGLPQIDRAVALYEAIVTGGMFQRIEAKLPEVTVAARAPAGGLLLKASDQTRQAEFRVLYTGLPAGTVNPHHRPGMVRIYRVETNVPWIRGPAQLAISTGQTSAHFSVDGGLLAEVPSGQEALGEVRLINDEQGAVVHTLPVTYVNDQSVVQEPLRADVELGSSEGTRRHFFVPPGVQGLLVDGRVHRGLPETVRFNVVDPQGNHLGGPTPVGGPVLIAVDQPGWYQATIARRGGSSASVLASTSVDAVQLRVLGAAVEEGGLSLLLENNGTELNFRLELRPEPLAVAEATQAAYLTDLVSHEFVLDRSGQLIVRVGTLSGRPVSDWNFTCLFTRHSPDGSPVQRGWISTEGKRLFLPDRDAGGSLYLECDSFERNDYLFSVERLVWHFELLQPFDDDTVLARGSAHLPSGHLADIPLDWDVNHFDSRAERVGVYVRPLSEGKTSLRLGSLALVRP